MQKKWFQSKTIITNIIVGILGFIPMISDDVLILFGIENTEKYLKILGLIAVVLNIILRVTTEKGIMNSISKDFDEEFASLIKLKKGGGAVIPDKGFKNKKK
jgi:hypothetical protein